MKTEPTPTLAAVAPVTTCSPSSELLINSQKTMNIADKLAILLKANGRSNPDAILLGRSERQAVESNREPCDPPDLSRDGKTFCGIPVVWSPEETRFAVVFNIRENANVDLPDTAAQDSATTTEIDG